MLKIFVNLIYLICTVLFFSDAYSQPLRKINNGAFKTGEVLAFRVHYGFVDAGEAILEVKEEKKKFGSRSTFHIVGTGRSMGTFDWFFKVRDRYETYIDDEAIVPWLFYRRVDEGGYKINQNMVFNHITDKVDSDGKIFDTPDNIQDMLSAYYYARCLDFASAKEGEVFTVDCFVDNQIYPLKIKFAGRETIKTPLGKFRCLKFRPIIQQGRVFKEEEDLSVWISDDKNLIPIRIQANLLVGSVKLDLKSYSGLANPVSRIAEK